MAELFARSLVFGAAVLVAGCGRAAVPAGEAVQAKAPAGPVAATPVTLTERLVRQRVGGGELRFEGARAFANGDVAVVCGSYAQAGRPVQRFVAVGDVDVWLEPDMAAGQMDRAFAEYCRDGSANA